MLSGNKTDKIPAAQIEVNVVLGQFLKACSIMLSARLTQRLALRFASPEKRGPSKDDSKNFYRCELCGGWVDRRDTVQVYDHIRPLPHPTEGREN